MIPTSFDGFISDPLFGIYMLCLVLILSLNFWFVVRPLNFLRIDYGMTVKRQEDQERTRITKGIKELISGPEKSTDQNIKVIRNYMLLQIAVTLLPLMIVLAVRIMLGDPRKVDDWGISQILIPCAVFSIWVLWNGYRAYSFSELIKPYLTRHQNWYQLRQYQRPRWVFTMIGITNLSRRNLKRLSEIRVPEYIKHEKLELEPLMIEDEYGGRSQINTKGIMENSGKIGKRISDSVKNTLTFGKEVAKGVSEQVTTKINDHIESKVKQWTESNSIVGGLIENLAIVFIPIITIYCVPLI